MSIEISYLLIELILLILLILLIFLLNQGRSFLFQIATKGKKEQDKNAIEKKSFLQLSISNLFNILEKVVSYLRITQIEYFPQIAELNNTREKALIYLVLVFFTFVLMFCLAEFFSLSLKNWQTIISVVISVVLVVSFFLILNLRVVLSIMRKNKQLSFYFFLFNPSILIMIALIIGLEFSFLYWVKEAATYFRQPFHWFIISYSLLILITAMYLGIRKNDKKFLKKHWIFILLATLDSIMIVLLANSFLLMVLTTIGY